jgi:hypothetical protein
VLVQHVGELVDVVQRVVDSPPDLADGLQRALSVESDPHRAAVEQLLDRIDHRVVERPAREDLGAERAVDLDDLPGAESGR